MLLVLRHKPLLVKKSLSLFLLVCSLSGCAKPLSRICAARSTLSRMWLRPLLGISNSRSFQTKFFLTPETTFCNNSCRNNHERPANVEKIFILYNKTCFYLEAEVGEAVNWCNLKNNLCSPNSEQHSSDFPWTHNTGYLCTANSAKLFSAYWCTNIRSSFLWTPTFIHPLPPYIVFIFKLSHSQSQSQGAVMSCLPETVIWSEIFFSALKMGNITYNHISRICSKSRSLEGIHSLPLHLSLVLVSMDSVALWSALLGGNLCPPFLPRNTSQ